MTPYPIFSEEKCLWGVSGLFAESKSREACDGVGLAGTLFIGRFDRMCAGTCPFGVICLSSQIQIVRL